MISVLFSLSITVSEYYYIVQNFEIFFASHRNTGGYSGVHYMIDFRWWLAAFCIKPKNAVSSEHGKGNQYRLSKSGRWVTHWNTKSDKQPRMRTPAADREAVSLWKGAKTFTLSMITACCSIVLSNFINHNGKNAIIWFNIIALMPTTLLRWPAQKKQLQVPPETQQPSTLSLQ